MSKISFAILIITTIALLLSCKHEEVSEVNPSRSGNAKTELEGVWSEVCHVNSGGVWIQRTIIFLGNTYTEVLAEYTDSACLTSISNIQITGSFVIGSSLTTNTGLNAKKLDITKISNQDVNSNNIFYTIFRIIDNNLYMGATNDAASASNSEVRLTKLDFDNYLINTDGDIPNQVETISSGEITFDGNMPPLAKASGCTACHAINKNIVGPSWKDVSMRYIVGSSSEREGLIAKIKAGGKGNWTEITKGVPMPPYSPRVKDGDIAALVDFILKLKKENLDETQSSEPIVNIDDIPSLAKKSGCMACHAIDRKIVGPSWNDVALRYSNDSVAEREALIAKVKAGGKGNWTDVTKEVPMPPYSPRVKDEDIISLVDYILGLDN